MTYDPVNRMTDSSYRKDDDTRTSDHSQVLGNLQSFETDFDVGHSTVDGSHGTINVPDLHEYATRNGLGVNQVPDIDERFALHLLHPTSSFVQVAFFQRADIGSSLDGIYEYQLTFGGDRAWAAYGCVERVDTE